MIATLLNTCLLLKMLAHLHALVSSMLINTGMYAILVVLLKTQDAVLFV